MTVYDDIWPAQLINDIARRRSVIVIGSGVSRHASSDCGMRPPVWKDFLNLALERIDKDNKYPHIKVAIDEGDLLHACEWIKEKFGEDWAPYLRSQFIDRKYKAGDLHRLIAMLDSRVVFSLNFDEVYEIESRKINESSQYVKNYYDSDVCEFLRGCDRYVVKVHGNLSSPAKLIFTQKEYAQARTKYSTFYTAFDAALSTHSFLFLGCGYNDPDVNLLLENQAFRFPLEESRPHYFVTSEEIHHDLVASLKSNRNLRTIMYNKNDNNHSGLTRMVEILVDKVNMERGYLTENTNW